MFRAKTLRSTGYRVTMSLQRTLDSALRWPAFLLSLFILFWSVPFCSLTYYIRFLDLKTERRGDVFSW